MLDWLKEHGDAIGNLAQGGIWILIVGFGLLRSLVNAGRKRTAGETTTAPNPRPTTAQQTRPTFDFPQLGPLEGTVIVTPTPGSPIARSTTKPKPFAAPTFGGGFDRPAPSDEDATLKWGSAFDKSTGDGYGTQWKSAFDEDRNAVKWGFDETEWGGGFAKKKPVKPTISVG